MHHEQCARTAWASTLWKGSNACLTASRAPGAVPPLHHTMVVLQRVAHRCIAGFQEPAGSAWCRFIHSIVECAYRYGIVVN